MKNVYSILFFICAISLQAQIVDIPDANFKNALVNTFCADLDGDGFLDGDADTNDDGEIQISEAEAVFYLFVEGQNIQSMTGIETFTNLEKLVCSENEIDTLDVSQNTALLQLWCAVNNITELDLSQNPNLNRLSCGANQLTTLDITSNPEISILTCAANNLTSLITANPSLNAIYCWENNLTSLDVSQNPNLEIVNCRDNNLSSLNISNGFNENIFTVYAYGNPDLFCIQVDDETATPPDCDFDNGFGWCVDKWTSYSEDCILGINDNESLSTVIYPNPVSNELNFMNEIPIEKIQIYTVNGSLMLDYSLKSKIDVSQLSRGIYFARLKSGSKTEIVRFIKQ